MPQVYYTRIRHVKRGYRHAAVQNIDGSGLLRVIPVIIAVRIHEGQKISGKGAQNSEITLVQHGNRGRMSEKSILIQNGKILAGNADLIVSIHISRHQRRHTVIKSPVSPIISSAIIEVSIYRVKSIKLADAFPQTFLIQQCSIRGKKINFFILSRQINPSLLIHSYRIYKSCPVEAAVQTSGLISDTAPLFRSYLVITIS